jgi:ribosomal protein L37AE/L43A
MAITRRVAGPFYVSCPHCGAKHGPFTRVSMGAWKCSRCPKTFTVR